jgi:hypothetical protein
MKQHPLVKDILGQTFGILTVVRRRASTKKGAALWLCHCKCGNTIVTNGNNLRRGNTKSCGCFRYRMGSEHPAWKGGRRETDDGYIELRVDGKRKFEHVVLMERKLGRPLRPHETVHHKNGIRNDNRLKNLELWSKAQPPGQRIVDKLTWCREFLAEYT